MIILLLVVMPILALSMMLGSNWSPNVLATARLALGIQTEDGALVTQVSSRLLCRVRNAERAVA